MIETHLGSSKSSFQLRVDSIAREAYPDFDFLEMIRKMDTELTTKEKRETQDPEKALKEIKDSAVMLSIANEYICDDPFLEKIGSNIRKSLEVVENHIEELKRQFVGKPIEEMDLSGPVNQLAQLATLLERADGGVKKKCAEGELGIELKERYMSLMSKVKELRDRIEGRSVSYTKTDSVVGFLSHFRFIVRTFVATSKFTLRITALFLIICLALFFYLFVTMETEKGPLESIEESRARILSKQASLDRINSQFKPLREKIEGLQKDELSRDEEIQLLELNLKAYKLSEEQQKAVIDMQNEEKVLEKRLKELERVRQKSFLERLLKQ